MHKALSVAAMTIFVFGFLGSSDAGYLGGPGTASACGASRVATMTSSIALQKRSQEPVSDGLPDHGC